MMRFFAKKIAAVQLAMMGKFKGNKMITALPLSWKNVPDEIKRFIELKREKPAHMYKEERITITLCNGDTLSFLLDDITGLYINVSESHDKG